MAIYMESDNIQSRADLVRLIHAMIQDLKINKKEWENRDLESFLEAMSAWINDMDGYYQNNNLELPQQPTWKTVGEILLAARTYE